MFLSFSVKQCCFPACSSLVKALASRIPLFYAPINGLPQDGGGGATPGKLTFKLASWEGILTVKYLLICTNYKGLSENLTFGEHPGEGNLKF